MFPEELTEQQFREKFRREHESNKAMWQIIDNPKGSHVEDLKLLLDAGASVQSRQIYGDSALCTLLKCRCIPEGMIELMILRGATARNIDEEKQMFSMYMRGGNPKLLQYLFENKIFENIQAVDFAYALQDLVMMCLPGAVDMLRVCITRAVAVGKNLDKLMSTLYPNGDNLLHLVISCSVPRDFPEQNYGVRPEMIRELIMNGCDVMHKNNLGNTPEQCAIRRNQPMRGTEDIVAIIPILREERLRLEKIEEERCIAFCMGNHPRVSGESNIRGLEDEVLRMILAFTKKRLLV